MRREKLDSNNGEGKNAGLLRKQLIRERGKSRPGTQFPRTRQASSAIFPWDCVYYLTGEAHAAAAADEIVKIDQSIFN